MIANSTELACLPLILRLRAPPCYQSLTHYDDLKGASHSCHKNSGYCATASLCCKEERWGHNPVNKKKRGKKQQNHISIHEAHAMAGT